MTQSLVECVPNFSEGSDRRTVERIAAMIETVAAVHVLDIHVDADHNRSVITFAGPPQAVGEAAVRAAGEAASWIDLNRHQGEHPRIGAADVIPFVPLRGVSMAECVAIAHRAGEELWSRFKIPVYFYEAAALRPERRNLETIRKGGFEKLRALVSNDPSRRPDVGEPRLHPTAGATAVGARRLLIAFNVNLNSTDREIARTIARTVRASSGGLPAVKAMGVVLRSKSCCGQPGQAQVSMNLVDWETTSPALAFEAVRREADRLGVTIQSSEIVGLVPAKALVGISPESLRLAGFGPQKTLGNRLAEFFLDTD